MQICSYFVSLIDPGNDYIISEVGVDHNIYKRGWDL